MTWGVAWWGYSTTQPIIRAIPPWVDTGTTVAQATESRCPLSQSAKEEIDGLVARNGIGWLVRRWEATINRVCPVTGRTVEFEDVLEGHYSLPRIDGNSENGYEVHPDWDYLVFLFRERLWDGKGLTKYQSR